LPETGDRSINGRRIIEEKRLRRRQVTGYKADDKRAGSSSSFNTNVCSQNPLLTRRDLPPLVLRPSALHTQRPPWYRQKEKGKTARPTSMQSSPCLCSSTVPASGATQRASRSV